ncbi:MAG TPA: hypothetical protein VIM55_04445 [Mucilaginibacter sp.]
MRKWVVAALSVLFFAGFIPVTKTVSFKINASFFNVYNQISLPKKWMHWQSDLKGITNLNDIKTDSAAENLTIKAPSISFKIIKGGLGNFVIEQNQSKKYSYVLMPDEKSGKTIVVVSESISIWRYLLTSIAGDATHRTPLGDLKTFMETPALYYGFNIQKKFTAEKLIVVEKASLSRVGFSEQSRRMLLDLNDFIAKNDLKITSPLQLQYVSEKPDSLQIMMGFPVDKKVASGNKVEYMTMPKGKILIGDFNGIYKDRRKLYDAMRRYMNDNYIRPMILPFEVFGNNKLPESDTAKVSMQLAIPYM